MQRTRRALFATIALLVSATVAAAAPPRWQIFDLQVDFDPIYTYYGPFALNDYGQVTGWGTDLSGMQGAPQGPFITQPNSVVNFAPRPGDPTLFVDQVVNGTYNNDPLNVSPDNSLRPAPRALNNLGVATGRGYSYPHDMTFLGSLTQTTAIGPLANVVTGYAINDASAVAGVLATDGGWLHAVRVAGGVTTDLGTFRTLPPTRDNDRSEAYAINAGGMIVGYAANDVFVPGIGANAIHAFRWTEATGLEDLGTAGGPVSIAYDVNNFGDVAGYSYDAGYNIVAVTWSPTNAVSVIPDFGPGTYPRVAKWINDAGWVVGTAATSTAPSTYFFHDDGQTHDLMALLDDDGQHWTNIEFTDMNQAGQLVGYGTHDNTRAGVRRVFVATPNMQPTATEVSLIDASAFAGRVALRWHSASHDLTATIERRGDDGDWAPLADVRGDAAGVVRYEDTDVVPGRRYGYRLAVASDGRTQYFGETWVEVPAGVALAVKGFHPNPSPGSPAVSFVLPHAGPARLELLDVTGRRVAAEEWVSLEGGAHTIRMNGESRLRPGVYLARLTFAGRTVTASGVILEP